MSLTVKSCKKCYSDINGQATICPFCKSGQGVLGLNLVRDGTGVIITLLMLAFIPFVLITNRIKATEQQASYTDLIIKSYAMDSYQSPSSSSFGHSCLYEVTNQTASDFSGLFLQADYFNAAGERVDSDTYFDDAVYSRSNSTVRSKTFRLDTRPQIEKSRCEVKILKARKA